MATIGGGFPALYVEISGSQLSGSGNSRSVRVSFKARVNGNTSTAYHSWYGFSARYRCYAQKGDGGWQYGAWTTLKGNETWYSSQSLRSFSQDITVDVGTTSSKTVTIGVEVDSTNDSSNAWDGSSNATMSVGATNVAPVMPTTNPSLSPGGTIPENTATIHVESPAASDGNGNLSGYRCRVSINNGGFTEVYRGGDRGFIHNVQGYGEGTSFAYIFDAYDASGAWSGNSGTAHATKNVMTGGWFTSHSQDIGYHTTEVTVVYTGGSNTNGSGVTYLVYSDNVTVHNQRETTESSTTITIWKNGQPTPSGPYILFDDLVRYFSGSSYNGRLHVGLRTRNNYGTDKWSGGSIGVDLRVNPQPARDQAIAASPDLSPIYKKVAFVDNYYFLPDGSGSVRVHWNNGWGLLGEAVRYELYVAYGSGGWQKVADVSSNGGEYHFYDHVIPKQTVSQQFKYLVRTVNTYGYYADVYTSARTLDFYNTPSIAIGTITRGAITADVNVTIKSNSSIPNISTVGSWLTDPVTSNGSLTSSQTEQTINVTGLTDEGTYTLKVIYRDNSGFSSDATRDIPIGQNSPIFFVNKYGAGIGGLKADAKQALRVKGAIGQNGGSISDFNTTLTEGEYSFGGSNLVGGPRTGDIYGKLVVKVNDGGVHNNNNNWIWQTAYMTQNTDVFRRSKTNGSGWTSWVKEYDTGNKPTAADVGAPSTTNAVMGQNGSGSSGASDAKYIYKSGFYDASGMANSPFGDWTWLINCAHTNNSGSYRYGMQIAGQNGTSNFAMRTTNVNGEGTWRTLYHTGNSPISYGSNSNGSYVRFDDGTQICWMLYVEVIATWTAYGNIFADTRDLTFPIAFASPPTVTCGGSSSGVTWGTGNAPSTTMFGHRLCCATNSGQLNCGRHYIAIGRWK